MSFVRPEIAAGLSRWQEVLLALGLGLVGLWIALSPRGPILPGFGWVLVAIAVALLPVAIRRARFVSSGDGPGVVRLSEGRISYLGPLHGGVVSLDELSSLGLRHEAGRAIWQLRDPATFLEVPVDALGADGLFDAFARLPGLRASVLLAALDAPSGDARTLWRRGTAPALTRPGTRSTS